MAEREAVVPLASTDVLAAPFCYLSGHKLVQFTDRERENFEAYVRNGGFVFVDDCNHDIDGLFAKSFEAEMASIFGPEALQKIANDHPLYRAFFRFEKGPPTTSFELNGWGDDLVHDYLKAIEIDGRIGVLYSNKDYGCEWDYDFRNKRFLAEDNTKFGVNIVMYAMTELRMSISPATAAAQTEAEIERLLARLPLLRQEIGKVIIGQQTVIEELLTAFLAGGHCLIEGLPGLGKTLLIRTLAQAVHLSFHRIQFTPDLMPSDIIGTEVLEEDHATGKRFFQFNPGPIFGQIILADEINRTPPKTQAALLEAMQEGSVTYGGKTHILERPFFVLATQNPIEQSGTYPLPEAQLDRFLLYLNIDYPREADELAMLASTTGKRAAEVEPVLTVTEILQLQALAREVAMSDDLLAYVNRLVRATRDRSLPYIAKWVRWGAGPRAGQALILSAKARALLAGRFAVTLDDLRALAAPVLRHRILLNFEAETENIQPDDVARELFRLVPEPKSPLQR